MGETWQELLQNSIRTVDELRKFIPMSDEEAAQMEPIILRYPLCINPYYLSLINIDDPDDPIRKMCIPDVNEFSEGGQADTSGENENTVVQGMQHKYKQTAMILSTNQCSMYCRHCFRKRMVGASSDEIAEHLPDMVAYVSQHTEIDNVLISGGDAFLNSNKTINQYLEAFSQIPTLDFIRFGTRTPVVLPQRISEDDELLQILEYYNERKQIIVVTQFNHPKEVTPEAIKAIRMLKEIGCVVRNQTVLLKGVNDNSSVLAELMNKLVSYGVIPYYIFQCRPVEGVKNQFQVPLMRGIDIVETAKEKMNGQAKSARYAMSHPTGKIEILGKTWDNKMVFKYHQAKYEEDQSRMFTEYIEPAQCWLD